MDYQTIPEQTEPELIARWESRGGKYWINLYYNPCFTWRTARTWSMHTIAVTVAAAR